MSSRSNLDMSLNIYDKYRITSENYRNAVMRELSYSAAMQEKEKILKQIHQMRVLAGENSISGFGKSAGLNKSTLNKLEEPHNPSVPHINTLNKLAKRAGFSNYEDFLQREGTGTYKTIEVPIMATAPGGTWSDTIDHIIDVVHYTPKSPGEFRGVRIRGRSLNRLVDDGAIAIVDISQRDPDKLVNQPVIIECGGEITAKIYRRDPERFEPYSDDPSFSPVYPNGECKIIGRIVSSQRDMPAKIK